MITPAVLIAAGCLSSSAQKWAGALESARTIGGITTPLRGAHWLAQVCHESGSLKYSVEIWGPTPAQSRYEGNKGLGNTSPGDGYRYRGRGLLQTTGRANYARARDSARKVGIPSVPDFVSSPDALALPEWAAVSAALWWRDNGANKWADLDDVIAVSGLVNRGDPAKPALHLERRAGLLSKIKAAMQ